MSRQPNCEEMARELGLSVKTVYRVMANSAQVKEDTRRRVIQSLNRHGFFAARCKAQQNVVFNFRTTDFSSRIIIPLMQNLSHRSFNCIVTEVEKNRARFEDAAADALVVVWGNEPDEKTLQYGKSLNPNAVHINLLGGGGGDISIDSDDVAGRAALPPQRPLPGDGGFGSGLQQRPRPRHRLHGGDEELQPEFALRTARIQLPRLLRTGPP